MFPLSTRSRLNYDNKGNLTNQKITKDGDVLFDAAYTYTADNKPDSIVLASADNSEIDYDYSGLNRLDNTIHTMKASSPTQQVRKSYTYATVGGNDTQTVSSVTYEKLSNGVVTNNYGTLSYTYDDNGNIETITQGQQLIARYEYDEHNQLVREDNAQSGYSMVYAYDAGGNLLTKEYYAYTTGTLGTMQADYDYGYDNTVWKDQMTDYDGTDLTYDAVGNLTGFGTNLHFTWDKGNQLAGIDFDLYNLSYTYKYDQNGMRTQKLANGNVYMDFTYIGDKLISQTDHIGNATLGFIYDAFGDMIGVKYNGQTYFYMRNLQGDVCGIYDSDGELIAKYTYDAWGKLLNITDANGVHISDMDSIAQVNPIRYRGYYYDSEFEFYYLQSRYYWPALGRFISADSLFMAGDALVGTNMYAYCSNNPVMYVDPSGHDDTSDILAKGIAVIIGVFIMAAFLEKFAASYAYAEALVDYLALCDTDISGMIQITIGLLLMKKVWPLGKEEPVDDYPNYTISGEPHRGTDLHAPEGTPIYAAVDGTVTAVEGSVPDNTMGTGGMASYGNYVDVITSSGVTIRYAHLMQGAQVSVGDTVSAGVTIIGYVGHTGNTGGNHVHFEAIYAGKNLNPMLFLPMY